MPTPQPSPCHRSRPRFVPLAVLLLFFLLTACASTTAPEPRPDPLPSWNDGPAKARILDFVERVTDPASPDFVLEAERIVTFDNDGTLWSEQPMYFQLMFAIDRLRALAPANPHWQTVEPFRSVLADGLAGLAKQGEAAIEPLLLATHTGMSATEFRREVRDWLETARHPRFDQPFDAMVYQPMLEVLAYFRANGFQTWIVSGGGIQFLRTFAEETYGIPPEQVVGTSIATRYALQDGRPVILREPELEFFNDAAGKPLAINLHIGRRPIAAFGNSDGDLQMLQWTHAGTGPRLAAYVHHTDGEREWAYDRESVIGGLDRGLVEAGEKGWLVVDMARDWAVIYPFDPKR